MESLVYVGMDVHKDTYSLCCYTPGDGDFFALDERDVQKPYGKAFRWLDDVMGGSDTDKRIGKGYRVIGMASVSQGNQPIPFLLHAYSAKADGFEQFYKTYGVGENDKIYVTPAGRLNI